MSTITGRPPISAIVDFSSGRIAIDTLARPRPPKQRRTKDERSFARAIASARAIVAEGHDRPSLVSNIACELAAEIIEGLRVPGDDLNSVELSRRFQTSRTPIREALMLLEKEGLVSIPPRRRPRVTSLAMEEVREIYQARAALFDLIATDVARRAPAEEIATLRTPLAEMERAYSNSDLNGFVWANVDFYDRNTQLANNRTVKRILDSLLLRTLRLRRLSLSQPGRMQQSLDDNARLLKAYEDRDATLAAALIRSNHINALAALEKCLSSQPQSAGAQHPTEELGA
ncbi:MAG TPA: GntR family transcriptional regulator [Pseudolabrys sp.]|nr:GntR family transcriptional regulator [Pseudolabrys sp.]